MKKFLFIIFLTYMLFNFHYTNATSIDISHCTLSSESKLCIKKAYSKNITVQSTLVKNSLENGAFLIESIDQFIKKAENSTQRINILATRIISELATLWSSERDQKLQLLFNYMLYKTQYTSIEQTHAAIDNKLGWDFEKTYKLDLPNTPKDIWDYLAIIDYLAEEEIWEYINNLDYKEKEKLAKKITLTNQEIINYFSVEERDVSNASTIEKNIYYRLLIFYEYLEENPDVWEEYKTKRNQK